MSANITQYHLKFVRQVALSAKNTLKKQTVSKFSHAGSFPQVMKTGSET
jgi:hypothetical protein